MLIDLNVTRFYFLLHFSLLLYTASVVSYAHNDKAVLFLLNATIITLGPSTIRYAIVLRNTGFSVSPSSQYDVRSESYGHVDWCHAANIINQNVRLTGAALHDNNEASAKVTTQYMVADSLR